MRCPWPAVSGCNVRVTAKALLLCALVIAVAGDSETTVTSVCDASCLTCNRTAGVCTSCVGARGLDKATGRCVQCQPGEGCLDCNRDFQNCTRCATSHWYLDKTQTCQRCTDERGCDSAFGCTPEGRCNRCAESSGYVRINGECKIFPWQCGSPGNTLPNGTCRRCTTGVVNAANGLCPTCPLLSPESLECAKCTANGACLGCIAGYSLRGNRCRRCKDGMCARCGKTPEVCELCFPQLGGLTPRGTCSSCADPNCKDCSLNFKVCTACKPDESGKTIRVASQGKCVTCQPGCHPCGISGVCQYDGAPTSLPCNSQGVCSRCNDGWGRMGNQCKPCQVTSKVQHCIQCDGNVTRCSACREAAVGGQGPLVSLYPNAAGNACVPCAEPHCKQCGTKGPEGACTECLEGYGLVNGKCLKCLVKGCKKCDGNPRACQDCGGNDWPRRVFVAFDPRTRTCVALPGTI